MDGHTKRMKDRFECPDCKKTFAAKHAMTFHHKKFHESVAEAEQAKKVSLLNDASTDDLNQVAKENQGGGLREETIASADDSPNKFTKDELTDYPQNSIGPQMCNADENSRDKLVLIRSSTEVSGSINK